MSVTPHIILTNLRYFVVALLAILQLYMHMMLLYCAIALPLQVLAISAIARKTTQVPTSANENQGCLTAKWPGG